MTDVTGGGNRREDYHNENGIGSEDGEIADETRDEHGETEHTTDENKIERDERPIHNREKYHVQLFVSISMTKEELETILL